MDKATPRPWHSTRTLIFGPKTELIADCCHSGSTSSDLANAASIVKAINERDELIIMLRALCTMIEKHQASMDMDMDDGPVFATAQSVVRRAEAAP